jgi:hypothetical protein
MADYAFPAELDYVRDSVERYLYLRPTFRPVDLDLLSEHDGPQILTEMHGRLMQAFPYVVVTEHRRAMRAWMGELQLYAKVLGTKLPSSELWQGSLHPDRLTSLASIPGLTFKQRRELL